jgi:hypothetical protein
LKIIKPSFSGLRRTTDLKLTADSELVSSPTLMPMPVNHLDISKIDLAIKRDRQDEQFDEIVSSMREDRGGRRFFFSRMLYLSYLYPVMT